MDKKAKNQKLMKKGGSSNSKHSFGFRSSKSGMNFDLVKSESNLSTTSGTSSVMSTKGQLKSTSDYDVMSISKTDIKGMARRQSLMSMKSTSDDVSTSSESFKNKSEYILSIIGFSVGFGAIWRFPYLIEKHGGVFWIIRILNLFNFFVFLAAFLIPCMVFLFFAGIPIFFIELAIGQRMRKGPIGSWNAVSPYLVGIGISAGVICLIVEVYYNTLLAWFISYFVWSWTFPDLPWKECKKYKNDNENVIYYTGIDSWENITDITETVGQEKHMKIHSPISECELAGSSAKYYWFRETLNISEDIRDFGYFNAFMPLWLILAWVLVYLVIVRGTKITAKIVYFTAIYPYVIIFAFFFGALFLENFAEGFRILYEPKWEKLAEGKVWLDAGTQIFFSLGIGFGSLIIFSSYSPFNNDCYFDSYLVPIINCATSLLFSIVMTMVLGSKGILQYKECLASRNETIYALINVSAILQPYFKDNYTIKSINYPENHFINYLNVTLINDNDDQITKPLWGSENNTENLIYAKYCDKEKIVRNTGEGTGMVFITFAEAVLQLPGSQFWSIIFFLMMITVGIDSSTVECVISCIWDLKIVKFKKWILISIVCAVYMTFAIGVFSHGFGIYVLTFLDELCVGWPLMIVALLECIGVSYVYGLKQFSYDVKLMTGKRPTFYLLFCWRIATPITIVTILLATVIMEFRHGAKYPVWRKHLGIIEYINLPQSHLYIAICINILAICAIPLCAILTKCGIRVLTEPRTELPEDELKFDRDYNSENDEGTTSPLQRAMMAENTKDFAQEVKNTIVIKDKRAKKSKVKKKDRLLTTSVTSL